jgi:mannose-6-phosphate isomerase-like protein (cupin superfamily)
MGKLDHKNIDSADEVRTFDKGRVEVVSLADVSFSRATFEPGWRWSECVKPIAGTDSCEFNHRTFIQSGRLHIRLDDGTEQELGAGDVAVIPPGHDAWVVGDEPVVSIDFDADDYAKPSS